ncbi:hypothetical protein [Parvicella tangerina]|uniref:Uncharacterized protein n=1 Tax=Parvicella tangerina TaxID=2829795 RepID=A0A916JNQ6_9FLAO|nr:hypothetical protein [Parvicella tangerina]CAG5084283.1 hypothetical protein CRYO30217_02426 [Parvicella tangerina]
MIQTYNVGTINWEPWEWILIPGLIIIIYFIGARYKIKKIGNNPEYKYFLTGLMFNVFAGLFFGAIYIFYYGGGDTISYYSSAIPLARLFWESPAEYVDVMLHSSEITENYSRMEWEAFTFNVFTNSTGIPLSFISHDPKSFMVCKLTSPLLILTGSSYFATTILISAITYIPMWLLYRRLLAHFPILLKELALAVIFIPSVAFWGSGIMKDSFTLAGTVLAVYSFDNLLDKKNINIKKVGYTILLLMSFLIILWIKPYILNILIPSLGIWIVALSLKNVKNMIFRFIVMPIVLVSGIGGSIFVLQSLGSSMDKFALDKAIDTAQITQEDLKREEQYGGNNFDIGELDGSIPNLLSKFPIATFAGLFRPTLLEVSSPVMLLSGLENFFLLGLLVLTLYKIKFKLIWQLIKSTPVLAFCFTFSILFAFMLGITTPNFGALVRFKIPLMPFLTAALLIIYSTDKILMAGEEEEHNR